MKHSYPYIKKWLSGICILTMIFLSISPDAKSQEIVNIIFVGENGITEKANEAINFIAVKSNPNGSFERLDYYMHGPLIRLRTYSDSTLKTLSGRYFEYTEEGRLYYKGYYQNNLKEDNWEYLNDTGKVVKKEKYSKGVLLAPDAEDTIVKKDSTLYGDEKEASFMGGNKSWTSYISKNIDPDASAKSAKGGKVIVRFVVDTKGKTSDIYLEKSVEFVLDEAVIKVIQDSPAWSPAFQNKKKVNAYRKQPLTFVKE